MENPSCVLSRHQFQSNKAMEETNDRISELRGDVLHYILSLMPMKFIVRTSILSRRWRNLWKHFWAYAAALDFGVEFTTGQTPEEFVATVNQYLQLHKAKEIQMFRLSFNPSNQYLSDAEKWVEFAVAKRVKEVDIDFSSEPIEGSRPCKLLNSIFSSDSITHLNLSGCDFSSPLNFNGYTYLKTLHLSYFRVTNALFETMLSNCPLLEELSLRDCRGLTRVKVSAPDLPLKSLTVVDCWDVREIEIFAPNLRSFRLYGNFIHISFKNISSLVDVLVDGMYRVVEGYTQTHDWITVLRHLEHVKILTLCNGSLMHLELAGEYRPEDFLVTFRNLQELQLLMDRHAGRFLRCIYSFFKNCPCPHLEKLFIELSYATEDPSERDDRWKGWRRVDTPEIVFDHLKVIKMNGFRGIGDEIQLVKFFLGKAIILESLVLVAHQKGVCNFDKVSAPLARLRKRLLKLAEASSSNAHILICEYSDDDGALAPMHAEVYHHVFFKYDL